MYFLKLLFIIDISLLSCILFAFADLTGHKEPEIKLRVVKATKKEKVIVAITHANLGNNILKNTIFWSHSAWIVSSLSQNPGLLAYKIKVNVWKGEAWTLTVWESEADLDRFVESKVHQTGVNKGHRAMRFAEFARLSLNCSEIPLDWAQIKAIMKKHGRSNDY